jgi:tripartite-type tricarboxylate transporter receptor subunit TctC
MNFRKISILTLLCLSAALAQSQIWPEKTIKLLAPSVAGGPPDVYARALADFMSKSFGQPVIVENVPAAGGMIAAQQIMREPADGYTLLVNTAGMMTIIPNANPRVQYKGSDFTQICQGVDAALVLATNQQLGPKDYRQLVQWLKAQKTPPTYSSYSPGSPAHFLGHQLSEALDVDMTHIPYKSSPPQITDMVGGVAPLGFVQIATASPHIRSGKLTAHATTGEKRSALLPDVPTIAELGLPQLTTSVWFGLSAPKGIPAAVAQRLTMAHQQMLATPEFKTRMAASGLNPTPDICGVSFQEKMSRESERWARIVKATGFSALE